MLCVGKLINAVQIERTNCKIKSKTLLVAVWYISSELCAFLSNPVLILLCYILLSEDGVVIGDVNFHKNRVALKILAR